ncbi:hypothetical protein MRGA327_21210 [Mycobacterium tuberculosis RGTB327]|nr:hypothetical protein MRGA327_21210 [Mycobacterium tuberculosis RGTB327]
MPVKPAAAEHGGRATETMAHQPELGGVHADFSRPKADTGHDVEGNAQIEGQIQDRWGQSALAVGGGGHDAP